jgi:predicted nucleic acid-binding protein
LVTLRLDSTLSIQPLLEGFPVNADEATTAGQITGLLKANGLTIERFDPIIAATAIEQAMPLTTGNTRQPCVTDKISEPRTFQTHRRTPNHP